MPGIQKQKPTMAKAATVTKTISKPYASKTGSIATSMRVKTVSAKKRQPSTPPKSSQSRARARARAPPSRLSDAMISSSAIMLAHSWKPDKHRADSSWLISEKLDGMRAIWDGERLMSRQGNTIHAPAFFTAGLPDGLVLDGELFAGRGKFNTAVSIARQHNAGEKWRELSFMVFDAPSAPGGFEARLEEANVALSAHPFAKVLPHEKCRGQEHLEAELQRVEAAGGEGLMMRKKGSAYEGRRSHNLLKVKTFKDDEAIVVGYQRGTGKHSGRMGALECRNRSGVLFKIGTGFSDAERERPPKVGSVVTYRFFELTPAKVPRFPAFIRVRPDVDRTEFGA